MQNDSDNTVAFSRTVLRRQGPQGKPTYRIPGLATTPSGTLIAVFDARYDGAGDLPADIDIVMMRSTDDGKTWSAPVNITANIRGRSAEWRLCFNGPGSGIQLSDGTLVLAAQYREANGTPHSTFIYSADGGDTWAIAPPAIPTAPPTSEAQVAELRDGSLLLTMRDESHSGKRAWARFERKKGTAQGTWGKAWSQLPDPTCMASIVRHPSGVLLFSNPNSATQRVGLTIRASRDEGKTWSSGRLIDARPCAYSCLTILKAGDVGVLYECGDRSAYETISFARVPLRAILEHSLSA